MEVKNILKKVVSLIGNTTLNNSIENETFSDVQQNEINMLVNCVNLTISNISSNYLKLYDIVEIENRGGIVNFSKISNKQIYDIVSVRNSHNKPISFNITPDGVNTQTGKVIIKFTYFPDDVNFNDNITCFPLKLTERVVVYGVLAEYLYAKGVFDEALAWENRFKNEMKSINRPQKSISTKVRRWR